MTTGYAVRPGATENVNEYVPKATGSARWRKIRLNTPAGTGTHLIFLPPLLATMREIIGLLAWPEEWDGYQMAPSHSAVAHAIAWIRDLHKDTETLDKEWIDPFVVADARGNVVFEWWKGRKKLTIYVSPTTSEYVKVWGPDIFSEMEDGGAETSEERRALWRWLMD